MSLPSNNITGTTLRAYLRSLGWTYRAVARAAGISESLMQKLSTGERTGERSRHKVEDALGVAIWSDAKDFARRQAGRKTFNPIQDPDTRMSTKFDINPLETAIAAVVKADDSIAASEERLEKTKTEVADYLSEIDPTDEKAVAIVSAKRTQIEVFPAYIEKALVKLRTQLCPALAEEIEAMQREYVAALKKERESVLDRWEKTLKPMAPDVTEANGEVRNVARAIAQSLPGMGVFAPRFPTLPAQRASAANPAAALIACAKEALALVETINKQGGIALNLK